MDSLISHLSFDATSAPPHTTTNSTGTHGDTTPDSVGFICAVVAVVLYGSNFVPVKKYKTGDGMFFQWILCSGIFFSGLILQMIHNSKVYVLPMLGGVIWAIGNLCVVPIIKTIGMGLGLSIWGTCALCIGWAIGRYGLFDTQEAAIKHLLMNDFSVVLAFVSIIILLMVKNEVSSSNMEMEIQPEENSPLLGNDYSRNKKELESSINRSQSSMERSATTDDSVLVFKAENPTEGYGDIKIDSKTSEGERTIEYTHRKETLRVVKDGKNQDKKRKGSGQANGGDDEEEESTFLDQFSENKKRLIGSGLSVFSGLMYGANFTPTLYVQNNYHGASQNGLDYVFAQFCGIYLTSTVFFVAYCVYKKNKPRLYPQVIVPGLISGVMWAIATGCWNVANSVLSQAISFPIVATGPCGIASLFWGVFIFGEIRGCKNISILTAAFLVNLTGSLLAGFSK